MVNRSVKIVTLDGSNGQKLEGCALYVNGVTAMSNPASLPVGLSAAFEARMSGYTPASASAMIAAGNGVQTVTLSLTPDAKQTGYLKIQFYPELDGINYKVTGASNFEGVSTGGTAECKNIAYGQYTVRGEHADYDAAEETVTVDGRKTVTLVLSKKLDSTPVGQAAQKDDQSFAAQLENAGAIYLPTDVSEQIPSNDALDGYFTAAQARVYVGNLFLDELSSIEYALQVNTVPVYGYSSRYADAYADGRSLVQGQLVLNWVYAGYLYTVIDEYRKMMQFEAQPDATGQQAKQLSNLVAYRKAVLASDKLKDNAALLDAKIDQLVQDPDAVRKARRQLAAAGTDPVYNNAAYAPVAFDLVVEIGSGSRRTVRKLEKCRVISNEQVIAGDGRSLLDAYGFIARRMR